MGGLQAEGSGDGEDWQRLVDFEWLMHSTARGSQEVSHVAEEGQPLPSGDYGLSRGVGGP